MEIKATPYFPEVVPDRRVYGRNVASCIDRAAEQAERFRIPFIDYLRIADLTGGKQGKHYVEFEGRMYRVHIKGVTGPNG